jgi:hypothetical protein
MAPPAAKRGRLVIRRSPAIMRRVTPEPVIAPRLARTGGPILPAGFGFLLRSRGRHRDYAFARSMSADGMTCLTTGKSLNPVQLRLQKYFRSSLTQITSISPAVPPHRGAYRDRHGRGMGCGGRGSVWHVRGSQGELNLVSGRRACGRQMLFADGKAVWSWHPLLVLNLRRLVGPDRVDETLIR